MPRDHRISKEDFPLAKASTLRQQGLSYHAIAAKIGWSFAHTRRMLMAIPTNGDHSAPTTLPQRVEVIGEPVSEPSAHQNAPERISASERIDSALLRDHESRLSVLEAFIGTLQQQPHLASASDAPQRISASAHSNALQRIEPPVWVNRGTHLAADMIERIKAYAREHRLDMREVLDLALRRFFEEGER
jgi:hypothetical protein